MDHVAMGQEERSVITSSSDWEQSYRSLPNLFLSLLILWVVVLCVWTFNTWTKRRWQTSNLQWMLASIPVLKSLVLGLSFTFWYSCLDLSACSFWLAFGIFFSRIFFETASFTIFLLISHGYSTTHDEITVSERRSIVGFASLLFLTLTGYKAAVYEFAVLVVLIYGLLLYVIMAHVARNLVVLREQLQQIQDGDVHVMQTAIYTKYTMFKRFQRAMLMMILAEILMHARPDGVAGEYWMRLLVRELAELSIFVYIGWTFRSRELTPYFTAVPSSNTSAQHILPPIYSVEINEKHLDHKEWHIGVPTPISKNGIAQRPMLVIVQNPGMSDADFSDDFTKEPRKPEGTFKIPSNVQLQRCSSSKGPDLSSSLIDHEGLQLRLRSTVDFSASVESGSRRDMNRLPGSCDRDVEGSRGVDGKEDRNAMLFTNDVVVDMKGFKGYSFLQIDNPCAGSRKFYSRSNSSIL